MTLMNKRRLENARRRETKPEKKEIEVVVDGQHRRTIPEVCPRRCCHSQPAHRARRDSTGTGTSARLTGMVAPLQRPYVRSYI